MHLGANNSNFVGRCLSSNLNWICHYSSKVPFPHSSDTVPLAFLQSCVSEGILCWKSKQMLAHILCFQGEKVLQNDEFTRDLFRFLQLLCEGHNSGKWNTLICQGKTTFRCKIMIHFMLPPLTQPIANSRTTVNPFLNLKKTLCNMSLASVI